MQGTTELMRKEIMTWDRGRIFFTDVFSGYESAWAVRFGLSQLTEEGFIVRLARGVYCYPRLEGEYSLRPVLPSEESIAMAVADRERIRIIPYGDQAACELGLTGIRLSELKYLTDGAPKKIRLVKGKTIHFNHTSEVKMFDFRNVTMQKISSAIRVLGKDLIGADQKRIIRAALRKVSEKEFLRDITIPPAWVQEIMIDIWNN